MPSCMSRGGKGIGAVMAYGVRTRIFFLSRRSFGSGGGLTVGGGGCRGVEGGSDGSIGVDFDCCGDGR